MNRETTLQEVIEILRQMDRRRTAIDAQTRLFTELDFDSLQMMVLFETLLDRYGVDFLAAPYSLNDLRTPATLVDALCRGAPAASAGRPTT